MLKTAVTRILALFSLTIFLAACATSVDVSQPIDDALKSSLVVKEATAKAANGVDVSTEVRDKLVAAVMKKAKAKQNGETPVRLDMTITLWDVRGGGTRAVAGALAGSNKMDISVDVVNVSSGETIGSYSVSRRSNPGGYGMFYDQADATINQGAEGVVDGLYKN